MGRLDEPDLLPAEKRRGPVIDPTGARPMVAMRNGAVQECRVLGWQRDEDGRLLIHLAWGVQGTPMHGWYVYDAKKVRERPG